MSDQDNLNSDDKTKQTDQVIPKDKEPDTKVSTDSTTKETEDVSVLGDQSAAKDLLDPQPKYEYQEYSDPVANSIVIALRDSKIDPNVAKTLFQEAVDTMDASKLDVKELAKLVGADKAELISLKLDKALSSMSSQVQDIVSAVHSEVGSESNWKKIMDWAKSQTDSEFLSKKEVYNRMLGEGKVQATLAAKELKALYEAASGNSSLGVKMIKGDKGSSVQSDKPMDKREYLAAVKRAHYSGNFEEENQLRDNYRRQLSQEGYSG